MSIPEVDSKNRLLQFLRASLQRIDFLNITNNATVDATLTAGAVNVTNNTAVSGTLTVGDGSLADEDILLILNSDRAWSFRQSGDGSSANLMLQNTYGTNKDFIIKTNGETRFFDNDGVERAAIDNDTGDMQIDGDLTVSGNDIKGSGGTAITMDASNNVALAQRLTIPNQPAFLAYLTADQTLTGGGVLDKVQFNAEAYDIANNFNPTAFNNSYSFTAPVAGRYLFATSLRIDDVANNSTQWVQGAINNVTTGRSYRIGLFDYDGVSKRFVTVAGSVIMNLAASDVVSVTVGVSSGTSSHVFGQSTLNGTHRSFFSGYFLG